MVHILHDNTIHSENILIQIRIFFIIHPSLILTLTFKTSFKKRLIQWKGYDKSKKKISQIQDTILKILAPLQYSMNTYISYICNNIQISFQKFTLHIQITNIIKPYSTLNPKTYLAWNRRMLKKAGQRWDTLAKISFFLRLSNVTAAIASSLCSFFFLLLDGVKTSHEVAIKQSVFSRETFASTYPRCKQTYRYTLQVCV